MKGLSLSVGLLAAFLGLAPGCKREHQPSNTPSILPESAAPEQQLTAACSSKTEALAYLGSIPHSDLTALCGDDDEPHYQQKQYSDLEQGLLTLTSASTTQEKKKIAMQLYNNTQYNLTTHQALLFVDQIKTNFFDEQYAFPLIAILGNMHLVDSSERNERAIADALRNLIYDPEIGNSRSQAITSFGNRGLQLFVRDEIIQDLKKIIQDPFFTRNERSAAGYELLRADLHDVKPASFRVLNIDDEDNNSRNGANPWNCFQAVYLRKISTVLIDYLARHSGITAQEISSVFSDDFVTFLEKDRSSNYSSKASGVYTQVVGGFFGNCLRLTRDASSAWVGAHESVHGLAAHLTKRNAEKEHKPYFDFGGDPYALEELITQQIVNEAVAELTGVSLSDVPLFVEGYNTLLLQPEAQALYRALKKTAGSEQAFYQTFLLSGGEEKARLYTRAIQSLYGEEGRAFFHNLNPKQPGDLKVKLQAYQGQKESNVVK